MAIAALPHCPPSSSPPLPPPSLFSPSSSGSTAGACAGFPRFHRPSSSAKVSLRIGGISPWNAAKPVDMAEGESGLKKMGVLSPMTLAEYEKLDSSEKISDVSITVVGASGDLAKKKIFPALFVLYYENCLPERFTIFGYARSKMTDSKLRDMVSGTLSCRIDKREDCGEKLEEFLGRCFYHSGQCDSEEDFLDLDKKLKLKEGGKACNRLFYLSIPPNIFIDVVRCAMLSASSSH